jgi:hypothetical protein
MSDDNYSEDDSTPEVRKSESEDDYYGSGEAAKMK